MMLAELNGKDIDAYVLWPRVIDAEIPEAEYRYMMALKDHVERYEPDAVEANPTTRIDLSKQAPIGPRS